MSIIKGAQIKKVEKESIAEEIGLEKGDIIKKINGHELNDILDYEYLVSEDTLEIEVIKNNCEEWILEIEKDPWESLGVFFESETFDGLKKCHNNCIFCFVSNLPKGLRKSLYIKDDDYRHSFLYGNYITLTNLKEEELKRIVDLKLSPLYVSVHTTDPDLRVKMLKNKNASKIMSLLKYLVKNGIQIHCQAVLCPGINDGIALQKTIEDLKNFWPGIETLALVPVGLTSFNKNPSVRLFTKEECKNIIKRTEKYQNNFLNELGTRFVFLADEFYLKAGQPIPNTEYYEDFSQIENGVGIVRLFLDEFEEKLSEIDYKKNFKKDYLLVTGESSFEILKKCALEVNKKLNGLNLEVVKVKNNFFGPTVTVTGLVTGSDIILSLKEYPNTKYKKVLIPDVMLKEGTNKFLDDLTVEDVSQKSGKEIIVVPSSGEKFIDFLVEER